MDPTLKRSLFAVGIGQCSLFGYIRRYYSRADYNSFLFRFSGGSHCRPLFDFYHFAQYFQRDAFRKILGQPVFVFMSFAAFSTVLAVFENIISATMDLTGWSRKNHA